MIESKFISKILEHIVEREHEYGLLKLQIKHLSIKENVYTGQGNFIYFEREEKIKQYKIENGLVLGELAIKSKKLNVDAEAILFVNEGLIDYLEIWSKTGEYPNYELDDFTIG